MSRPPLSRPHGPVCSLLGKPATFLHIRLLFCFLSVSAQMCMYVSVCVGMHMCECALAGSGTLLAAPAPSSRDRGERRGLTQEARAACGQFREEGNVGVGQGRAREVHAGRCLLKDMGTQG